MNLKFHQDILQTILHGENVEWLQSKWLLFSATKDPKIPKWADQITWCEATTSWVLELKIKNRVELVPWSIAPIKVSSPLAIFILSLYLAFRFSSKNRFQNFRNFTPPKNFYSRRMFQTWNRKILNEKWRHDRIKIFKLWNFESRSPSWTVFAVRPNSVFGQSGSGQPEK